jgi:beta-phosphoglucomutase-like phosphatase (HAD superfamily)
VFAATLFDYNGVLVDDEAVHLAAFRDVLEPLGIALSEAEYWERYLGFDDRGVFRAVLEAAGRPAPDSEVSRLVETKRPAYLARARGTLRGFEGAAELVKRRAAAGPAVIVSGALRDEIELGLSVLGVRDAISGIVSAEDTARSKPDPEGYHLGIALVSKLGVTEPREVLVFEDSVDGIAAARAALLPCVGIGHTYPEPALVAAGASLTVARIADVTDDALRALHDRLRA